MSNCSLNMKQLLASMAFLISFIFVPLSGFAGETLKVVENEKVCMVTDMFFAKKQIPVTHQGKTYYGCCQNCKKTLSEDANARKATDPVNGKSIDKASAVIAAREDNSVVYFESQKTFEQFKKHQAK